VPVECDLEGSTSELDPDPVPDQLRVSGTVVSSRDAQGGYVGDRLKTYTAYGIACGVVWAAILGLLAASDEKERFRKVLPVFGGWWIGWTSATIARSVYPP
jgi:hypothetical protein